MATRADDLKHALRLSGVSIVWSGVAGSIALIALAIYLAFGAIRAMAAQAHPQTSLISLGLLLASAVVLPPLAIANTGWPLASAAVPCEPTAS